MQTITPSDICGICMDEGNRDFLYKTCCTFLLCRKCFNQVELEAFPTPSNCPGCRQKFTKVTFSVDTVNNSVVPRAYCGAALLPAEQESHVQNCVDCLKKVVKGNMWFEIQLGEKFKTLKRKLSVYEDELFVRNTRIRELTHENRNLAKELFLRNNHIQLLQRRRAQPRPTPEIVTTEEIERARVPEANNVSSSEVENVLSSSTDLLSSSQESDASETPLTPPRAVARTLTTPPRLQRERPRRRFTPETTTSSPLRRSERLLFLAAQIE